MGYLTNRIFKQSCNLPYHDIKVIILPRQNLKSALKYLTRCTFLQYIDLSDNMLGDNP